MDNLRIFRAETARPSQGLKVQEGEARRPQGDVLDYLKKGVSKLSVAKIIGCSPSTLYEWIYRNKLKSYVRRRGQK
jgi:transposase